MSAEEDLAPVIATELDEAEFSTFVINFIGPMASALPAAFRQVFEQLTGSTEFPEYRTYKLKGEGPAEAFYLSLQGEETGYTLELPNNFYKGTVSPDAMGLILTLYVFNTMLWSGAMPERTARYVHNGFYLLRDFAAQHPEATEIYGAID